MEPQKRTRKKRTRKKKELPSWSQSLNEGTTSKLLTPNRIQQYNINIDRTLEEAIVMTPYSDYVPIDYLFFYSTEIGSISQGNLEGAIHTRNNLLSPRWQSATTEERGMARKILQKGNPPVLNMFARRIDKDKTLVDVSDYLNYDSPISMNGAAYWGGGKNESVLRSFCGGSNYHHTVNMRSFHGYTGHHMFLLRENTDTVRPEIVLAVPRKLYMDVKMRFCLTGEIDLSKCILFIDRDLDKPTFTPVQFRANTYRKYLKPYLDTLKVDVFKVPSDFIKNSCFLQNYKLRESSPAKRKEEKEMIIKEFYRVIKEKYPQVNDSPSIGLSGMTYVGGTTTITSGYTGTTGTFTYGVDPHSYAGGPIGIGTIYDSSGSLSVNPSASNPVSLGGTLATDTLSAEETRAILNEGRTLVASTGEDDEDQEEEPYIDSDDFEDDGEELEF